MIEVINAIGNVWWAWMWPMFWQVSLLVGLIALIDLLLRKRVWPQVRYALWLLVLVKLVLPPGLALPTSLTSGFGPLAWGIVKELPVAEQSKEADQQGTSPALQDALPIAPAVTVDPTAGIEPRSVPGGSAAFVEAAPPQTTPSNAEPIVAGPPAVPAGPTLSWQAGVMLAWAAGAVVLAGWLGIKLGQLRRVHSGKRASTRVPERFNQLLTETAKKLKLRRLPEVVLSQRVASPAVFGVFKPVLLMPAKELERLSRTEVEHVLLHELSHIKRGDLIIHGLNMLLQIVYWFNPLLWLVRRKLQHLRELCCDATVGRILRERTPDYSQTILETARRMLSEPVGPGMGLLGLFENANRLLVRLKWLEKNPWKHRPLRIATALAVIAVMCVCVLPMAKSVPAGVFPQLQVLGQERLRRYRAECLCY